MIDSSFLPLAQFDGEVMIPIVAIVFFMLIPIVAILTTHQRRMAELMRNDGQLNIPGIPNLPQPPMNLPTPNSDIQGLRQDVQQLREMVTALTINLDNMNDRMNQQNTIQDRVKVGE